MLIPLATLESQLQDTQRDEKKKETLQGEIKELVDILPDVESKVNPMYLLTIHLMKIGYHFGRKHFISDLYSRYGAIYTTSYIETWH